MIKRLALSLFFCGLALIVLGIIAGVFFKENRSLPISLKTASPPVISISSSISTSSAQDRNLVKVIRVIDGDTIQVLANKKLETVRLIGIDAPETVDQKKKPQCFGKEASAKAQEMLNNQNILLEPDPTQGEKDIYGRFLDYVFLANGTNFDMFMVRKGFAREYTYKSNPYKYQKEFINAQTLAKNENLGLWKVCQ